MKLFESMNLTSILIVVTLAFAGFVNADTSSSDKNNEASTKAGQTLGESYLLATPQIQNPLQPLANTAAAIEEMEIHSAVVTVADPLETHLARMFDIQLSSLIRAYHARSYVLDGFAFTWDPERGSGLDKGKRLPEGGTESFRADQREIPSVLVFRKDLWRENDRSWTRENNPGVRYVVLFLVGESPTFGAQPRTFQRAARCAAALNGAGSLGHEILSKNCSKLLVENIPKGAVLDLDIIGPTFSGSMQSLALTLGELIKSTPSNHFKVNVTSPSATVTSNQNIETWAKELAAEEGNEVSIDYCSLAATLEKQLRALCGIDAIQSDDKIVILTEESTFGRGVYDILNKWSEGIEDIGGKHSGTNCPSHTYSDDSVNVSSCAKRIRVTQFPQNISAVRAEHSRRDQDSSVVLKSVTQSKGQLLELNLTTVDEAADRPPPYDRLLSSRSDELMLYGTFDAMKVWVKPAAVAIVATDIRDRLFLLNEVRKNLPMALPVLMEMDFLTAHPDYRKISRGSVVIPNGNTLVKLDVHTGHFVGDKHQHSVQATSYYSFPSDYSANIFRAALGFIDHFERETEPLNNAKDEKPKKEEKESSWIAEWLDEKKKELKIKLGTITCREKPGRSGVLEPLVTTLSGFQKQNGCGSKMLAADSRLSMERPVYMMFLIIGILFSFLAQWLLVNRQRDIIMMRPFSRFNPKRYLTEDADPANKSVKANESANADEPIKTNESAKTPAPSKERTWISWLLMMVSISLLSIAAARLWLILVQENYELMWNLPHGRDVWALICIFLIYVAIAIVGFWRLYLWRKRYNEYLGTGGEIGLYLYDHKCQGGQGISRIEPFFWIFISLALTALVVKKIFATPTSIDNLWPPTIVSLLVLPVGAWFLVQFWKQWRNWNHFAMVLCQTMDIVSDNLTGKGKHFSRSEGWPNPLAIGDRTQSPFNLKIRSQDLEVLIESPHRAKWSEDTRKLINRGEWPFGKGMSRAFERWQAQLVAEMRFAAVAVRACAWCAILAPTFVLWGMDVYPAPWERLQTIISISLIVATFMAIMFVVLRLERHPLLSRLFTLHGTSLSLGGAFSALWPKLIAAVIILIPVLFPDVMEWLYTLLRSINSLN